ncbi:glycoside hydrolase superfamily [Rhizoctonia solani]|nr:glycoside hydrolase superfamily [Rhizoctonia solani]
MDQLLGYLPGLAASGAHIEPVPAKPADSFCAYTLLFSLQSEKESSLITAPIISSFNLGRPGEGIINALRLTRDKCYWLFAHQNGTLPSHTDTQILALRSSKHVVALLPLTTNACMGTLRGPLFEPEKDLIFARFERSHSATETGQLVVTIAKDINTAIKGAIIQARLLLNVPGPLANTPPLNSYIFENKLTYCTWNSLQPPTPTTGASALNALEHFHSIGIRPAAFLIDDAWQDVKSFRLQSFSCKQLFLDKFSELSEIVKIAKDKYGVEQVGVWHTIQGYWQGVEPSKFASQYSLIKVTKDGYPGPAEEESFEYYIPHPDSVQNFFNDYYTTLRIAGITFTKCDNMASIDHINSAVEVTFAKSGEEVFGNSIDIVALRKAYVQAVTTAALESFGAANVIWCMGMTPRVLLGEIGLCGKGVKRVMRNSDDYYPNEPDSHRYHIFTNTINALLLNELDVQPDLDMFQSHPYVSPDGTIDNTATGTSQGSFHASFRVFGTGPVTITDVPSKSNREILTKMVGDSAPTDSPSVVVQASTAFTVLNDVFDPCIMWSGQGKGLKVYADKTIGIWNVKSGDGKLVEFIIPSDISQALDIPSNSIPAVVLYIQSSNPANERIVLRDVSNALHPNPPIRIELDPLGWATVSVVKVESLGDQGKFACPGLVDKYLALQGVTNARVNGEGAGWTYTVMSKCSGTLGLWTTSEVSIKRTEISLIGENGDLTSSPRPELETQNIGKANWTTVKLKGRSKIVFHMVE